MNHNGEAQVYDPSDPRYLKVLMQGVGEFFEALAEYLIGGKITEKETHQDYDIDVPGRNAWVEVKGRNYNNPFLISVTQLKARQQACDSNLWKPNLWFVLFRYGKDYVNNSKCGAGRAQNGAELSRYLASKTHTCHVLDEEVIEAIRAKEGTIWVSWGEAKREVVKISYKPHLEKFVEDPRAALRSLHLDPSRFKITRKPTLKICFLGYPMMFAYIEVVRRQRPVRTTSQNPPG